jgi:hypothetical protein
MDSNNDKASLDSCQCNVSQYTNHFDLKTNEDCTSLESERDSLKRNTCWCTGVV